MGRRHSARAAALVGGGTGIHQEWRTITLLYLTCHKETAVSRRTSSINSTFMRRANQRTVKAAQLANAEVW